MNEDLNIQDLPGLTISVNINQTNQSKSDYDATKESWVIDSKKVKDIHYVVSEINGIIQNIYNVNKWIPFNGRWSFEGTSVSNSYPKLIRKRIPKSSGERNPVKYLNF